MENVQFMKLFTLGWNCFEKPINANLFKNIMEVVSDFDSCDQGVLLCFLLQSGGRVKRVLSLVKKRQLYKKWQFTYCSENHPFIELFAI